MQRWLGLLRTPVRKRPAAGPAYEKQSIDQLSDYDAWGREQVAQNAELTYRQLQRLLEHEHGVTAANNTMERCLASLLEAPKAYGRYRTVACSALESLSMEELSAYDD